MKTFYLIGGGIVFLIIGLGLLTDDSIFLGILFLIGGIVLFLWGLIPYIGSKKENRKKKQSIKLRIQIVNELLKKFNLSSIPDTTKKLICLDSIEYIREVSKEEFNSSYSLHLLYECFDCCVTDFAEMCDMIYAIIIFHCANIYDALMKIKEQEGIREIRIRDAKRQCFLHIYKHIRDASTIDVQSDSFKEELIRIVRATGYKPHYTPKHQTMPPSTDTSVEKNVDAVDTKDIIEGEVKNIIAVIEKHIDNFEADDEAESSGIDFSNALLRLDYSIYIFFNLYVILCGSRNEKLVTKFSSIYEQALKKHFEEAIGDGALLDSIFDDRLIAYDQIMRTSYDKDGDLIDKITKFILNDLYTDNPISKTQFIAGITEEMSLKMSISTLYQHIMDEIKPSFSKLPDLVI